MKLLIDGRYILNLPPSCSPLEISFTPVSYNYSTRKHVVQQDTDAPEMKLLNDSDVFDTNTAPDSDLQSMISSLNKKIEEMESTTSKQSQDLTRTKFMLENQAKLMAKGYSKQQVTDAVGCTSYWNLSIESVLTTLTKKN